jgi:hypothetical protein
MSARLPTQLRVAALVRHADVRGDGAMVLKKGDATAGQLLLVARRRNGDVQVFSRTMNSSGAYSWTVMAEARQDELAKVNEYLDRQTRYDPDLWIVELNTENPERFVDDELI